MVGALIYVKPGEYGCLVYRVYTAKKRQAFALADEADAEVFASARNLIVIHNDKEGKK